ncbi:hypothetical protein [Mycobacterium sp. 852002-53434_SCH5985345]|uniref:ORC-CDC6 family AAA ATPase n=1 Tax=Mycobacterium sp. 852002-53434_SCH5985345 TaxID=1834107 RepID=UPI0012E7EAE5|nr:hypothetical protein [Mycobacterium sp. 852002-53434_SCH5985345]
MTVEDIVKTFVEPAQFKRLRQPVNSLLSGPRGAGKTTMMKMLQPEALEKWSSPNAMTISNEIAYTGVFIATDRTWKRQIEPPIRGDKPFHPVVSIITEAAFTCHVLREIVLAMRYRLSPEWPGTVKRSRGRIIDGSEASLSMKVADLSGLDKYEPSLNGVADALTIRLARLYGLQKAYRNGEEPPIPGWITTDCLAAASAVIDLFNRAVQQENHQWALLFDEMELAPTMIVQSLIDGMRGLPENLLLKLSISPVQPELSVLNLPYAGVPGQDFDLIQLTSARQSNSVEIGRRMLVAELKRRNIQVSPVRLLGKSVFASNDEGDGGVDRTDASARYSSYATNSSLLRRYKSLASIDKTFSEWLRDKDVDLDDLERLSPSDRAAKLRKIRNLVVVREHYRKAETMRRSRKSYGLYTGMDTVAAFCDGNPRLLTALIGQMLAPRTIIEGRVSRPDQSKAIESVMSRFFALIDSAEGVRDKRGHIATLADLVDQIGDALADRVIDFPFSDNVPLSFSVDRGVSDEAMQLLQSGINIGVFIHIPKRSDRRLRSDERVPLDLAGEQFRLSYVLAPYFGLPVRLGRSVALSDLLSQRARYRREGKSKVINEGHTVSQQYSFFPDLTKAE